MAITEVQLCACVLVKVGSMLPTGLSVLSYFLILFPLTFLTCR